ncbi:two-component system regulatory protein YycI [Lacticaseibacillus hulanensis]|uniref:two-component system regulatory protein YycI n=1 Tax=Lacticaseibacillus hulanensis TaxID=2493111 RepID=UPI000FDC4C9C|nr:two-component system regulatory protein YycI [Lacticaseibacillus hulanensis]
MDFRRIEWIFLVVFVALDIFLGWSMAQNQRVYLSTGTTGGTNQVMRDIKDDDIALPELSTKTSTGAYLASRGNNDLADHYMQVAKSGDQSINVNKGAYVTLDATLNNPLTLRKDDNVATQLTDWVQSSANVLYGHEYVYQKYLSTDTSYVFAQKVNGRLLLDDRGQLILTVHDGKLTGYTQTYVDKLLTMRNDETVISEREAVTTLYQSNEIVANSRVIWINKGYTWLLDAKGSTVYIPAYFVGIESKNSKSVSIKRINAITKAVIKTH